MLEAGLCNELIVCAQVTGSSTRCDLQILATVDMSSKQLHEP